MLYACQQGGVGKTSVLSTSKKRRRDFLKTTTRGPHGKLFHTLHRSEEIQTAHLQTPQIAESFVSLRSVPRCSCSECGSQDPQALRLIPTLSALPANADASAANERCSQCMETCSKYLPPCLPRLGHPHAAQTCPIVAIPLASTSRTPRPHAVTRKTVAPRAIPP
jgi:hypothetical protein